jgi:quinoprotein glucose dehydrogenase
VIYKNILISGAANPYKDGRPSGDIRGFDLKTGKQLWRFNTIPVKGEAGYDSWAPGSAERNSGVHVWGLMTLDAQRGIVYAPLNAPNWNRYGGDHVGDNLYGSSIVALNANTGKLLWHFQIVHHDIWDMDADAPSTLFDVHKDGKVIPAIGAISKSALLFILDRVTGKPIFGVQERPVPQSEVPGEKTSPTQPFPVKPEPLGRQTMSMDEIANVTPEHRQACLDMMKTNNVTVGGPYMPPGYNHPSVNFPGPNGSVNWGGGSFDPKLGYYIVNSQDLGQLTEEGLQGSQPMQANGVTGGNAPLNNDNIPYAMVGLNGRFKQLSSGMMCQQPPWGRLTAVNVNTGDIAWQVPLGITESLPPAQQKTGRPNSGGSIVTASGLVFIGATDDSRFRAFDAKTGKEVWTIKIPAGSHSVPVTYMGKDGKQYLVFPATGGDFIEDPGADDELLAYRLP